MAKEYNVLSPDGFPISHHWFKSKVEAWGYAVYWVKQFEEQGYYRDSRWRKIPLDDLPDYLEIIEAKDWPCR